MAAQSELQRISEDKIQIIKNLSQLIEKHSVIGVLKLDGISTNVIQGVRAAIRENSTIKIAKNTLKTLAIDACVKKKPGIQKLKEHIDGSCALVFTNHDPFYLQSILQKTQMPVPAKVGQEVPDDVIVPAGDTGLNPGPVMSQFREAGITTRVEQGKIKIVKDTKMLSKGDIVTENHASILAKLDIKPILLGMTLSAAFENGDVLTDIVIDIEGTKDQLAQASQYVMNLALKVAYYTPQTITSLLQVAHIHALGLQNSTSNE
ncbi:MAG: 50S ribosomal protein L10 [Candidatus Hodarchaeota archaeon]